MTSPESVTPSLAELSEKATPGPWKAEPKRLVVNGQQGPIMSYLYGNGSTPEGMRVSLGSERIADHEFVAALVNAFRAGELVAKADADHWKRMYECAQNANSYRQSALESTERSESGRNEHLKGDDPRLEPCAGTRGANTPEGGSGAHTAVDVQSDKGGEVTPRTDEFFSLVGEEPEWDGAIAFARELELELAETRRQLAKSRIATVKAQQSAPSASAQTVPIEVASLISTAEMHLRTWATSKNKDPYGNTLDVANRLKRLLEVGLSEYVICGQSKEP